RSIQVPETALARPTIPSSAEPFLIWRVHPPLSLARILVPPSVQALCPTQRLGSATCSRSSCPETSALVDQLRQRTIVPVGAPSARPIPRSLAPLHQVRDEPMRLHHVAVGHRAHESVAGAVDDRECLACV